MPDILQERTPNGVVTLTLNRPDALNAFSFAMYDELIALLEGLRHDASARVVILTGAGRAFCAGHDLRGGGAAPWVDPELGKPYAAKRSCQLNRSPVLPVRKARRRTIVSTVRPKPISAHSAGSGMAAI